jgi:hypothetical protein
MSFLVHFCFVFDVFSGARLTLVFLVELKPRCYSFTKQSLPIATLASGNPVTLIGFGSFEVERKGRNPQTGEEITIAAANIPSFKPGKALKDAVNH